MNGKQRPVKKDYNSKSFATRVAVSAAVSVIIYFVLVAVYALIALKTGSGAGMYMPIGILFGALSGLVGGFVAAKSIKQKGIIYGALSGLISAIVCSIVLFAVNGNKAGSGIFIFMAAMLLGAAVGGVAAMNLKTKKKY